jgi:hypothetical protein
MAARTKMRKFMKSSVFGGQNNGNRLTYATLKRQVAPLSPEPNVYLNVVFDTEVNIRSEDMIVIALPAG